MLKKATSVVSGITPSRDEEKFGRGVAMQARRDLAGAAPNCNALTVV